MEKAVDAKRDQDSFLAFMAKKKVLIADSSSSNRAGLARILSSLGIKTAQITFASEYTVAEQEIATKKPEVVICDFDLGKGRGLHLLQAQRAQNPDSRSCLFVIVTGNSSQSAVAQAAEEDCDAYIIKPYTGVQVKLALVNAAVAKQSPSPYFQLIEDGKSLLLSGKLDEALAKFVDAEKTDRAPSLALYYQGQVHFLKQVLEEAGSKYQTGLEFNKIHYRCLVGMYDLLSKQNKSAEAYEIVKRIARYFPGNPNRLNSILRLAITTKSYEDIEGFYQAFTNMDVRNDEMVRYICAALIITAKFYLGSAHHARAMTLLEKASATGSGKPKILREIISALVEYRLQNEAERILQKFPGEVHGKEDYLIAKFLIQSLSSAPSRLIQFGRDMIKKDIHSQEVYRVMISRLEEMGKKDEAQDLAHQAKKRWPQIQDQSKAEKKAA